MKKISSILTVVSLLSVSAFATDFTLPDDSQSLRRIQGEVIEPDAPSGCPAQAACDPAANVKLKFVLSGCLNTLGPVTYTTPVRAADGKLDLYVSAFEIVNSKSPNVRCFVAPTATVKLVVGIGSIPKDQVRVHFLDGVGRVQSF